MQNSQNNINLRKKAFNIIILFGFVSLFGDVVYEGARSVNGPYLKLLAANAVTIGIIAGVGEFLGYALRLISGYLSDRIRFYWFFTFLGYAMLISVPLLSIAGIWQVAAVFIILERIGKAIRSPARDTILSQASSQLGTGFGFGLHEAMDQIGAILGPLIFATFFIFGSAQKNLTDYQRGYQFLWIPFILLMFCVVFAYFRSAHPEELESSVKEETEPEKFSKVFWLYSIFIFVTTLGFANFILIGYHFKKAGVLSDFQIPIFYALAMAVDAVAALSIGRIYDSLKIKKKNKKAGLGALIVIPVLSIVIPITVFSKCSAFCLAGVIIWGVVMGCHETIMRSAIADITHIKKRGTGYGIFNTIYAVGLFLGSVLFGFLYDYSISALIIVAAILQFLAIPIFIKIKKEAQVLIIKE